MQKSPRAQLRADALAAGKDVAADDLVERRQARRVEHAIEQALQMRLDLRKMCVREELQMPSLWPDSRALFPKSPSESKMWRRNSLSFAESSATARCCRVDARCDRGSAPIGLAGNRPEPLSASARS